MKKLLFLPGMASMTCSAVFAQEVVHALTGVVTAVNPASSTIRVKTNDGSEGDFVYQKRLTASLEFDKSIREQATDPSGYKKIGDHAIVYFFGDGAERTVVALKDLGANPLDVSAGAVLPSHSHHALEIKTRIGAIETYQIAKDATIDTPEGVISGMKFNPEMEQGSDVTVRYAATGEEKIAQFISAD